MVGHLIGIVHLRAKEVQNLLGAMNNKHGRTAPRRVPTLLICRELCFSVRLYLQKVGRSTMPHQQVRGASPGVGQTRDGAAQLAQDGDEFSLITIYTSSCSHRATASRCPLQPRELLVASTVNRASSRVRSW